MLSMKPNILNPRLAYPTKLDKTLRVPKKSSLKLVIKDSTKIKGIILVLSSPANTHSIAFDESKSKYSAELVLIILTHRFIPLLTLGFEFKNSPNWSDSWKILGNALLYS